MSRFSTVFFTASLASLALARTDLTGCTSTDVSSPAGASIAWYVPGTGELCDFLDCGGGRAPPKTTVPGCPLYSGTATYSPSYLPGYGSMTASSSEASSTAVVTSSTEVSSAEASSSTSSDAVITSSYGSATETGAGSETSETLDNSAVAITSVVTSTAATSSAFTTITSSPAAGVGAGSTSSNGTSTGSGSTGSGSGTNGTVSSGTPSPIESNSGAMETARVWLGGSALVGLGALVAAL